MSLSETSLLLTWIALVFFISVVLHTLKTSDLHSVAQYQINATCYVSKSITDLQYRSVTYLCGTDFRPFSFNRIFSNFVP